MIDLVEYRHLKYFLAIADANGFRAAAEALHTSQAGTTAAPKDKRIALAISSQPTAQGLRLLYRGSEQTFLDAPLHIYFRNAVFEGEQLRDIYKRPLLFGLLPLLGQLPFSIGKDIRRRKELKYGRRG